MAKKKQPKTPAPKESKSPAAVKKSPVDSHEHCAELCAGLTREVHSFLGKRDELAQKLAREIECTEKKLAELKHAAAMLYPDKDSGLDGDSDSTSSLLGLRASS